MSSEKPADPMKKAIADAFAVGGVGGYSSELKDQTVGLGAGQIGGIKPAVGVGMGKTDAAAVKVEEIKCDSETNRNNCEIQ